MKYCGGCNKYKNENEFNKNRHRKDGFGCYCRDCCKKYYPSKEKKRQYDIQYYANHTEEIDLKRRQYRDSHKEEKRQYDKQYRKNKYKNDINYKIRYLLRRRLRHAIKNNQKSGSAIRDLGCSVCNLKIYLEKQFYENMNWDNFGSYWHIDHIIPLAIFDLTNRKQLLVACNYKNLKPMLAEENLNKCSKIIPEEIQKYYTEEEIAEIEKLLQIKLLPEKEEKCQTFQS